MDSVTSFGSLLIDHFCAIMGLNLCLQADGVFGLVSDHIKHYSVFSSVLQVL